MAKNPIILELYRSYDPVIRAHVPPRDAGRYARSRDPEILFESGLPRDAKPILFVCKALSRSQREGLEMIGADHTRWRAAFRVSLVEIRDLTGDDGKPLNPPIFKPGRPGPDQPIDDQALEVLEELGFRDADVWEIGSAVEELSTVGKGVPPSCPLLDSSRRAWNTPSSSRRAEQPTEGEVPAES